MVAGCAPTIDTTRLGGPYPPRGAQDDILVYSTRMPECPFVEVAVLAGFEGNLGSLETTLKALQERTRALGGDALVRLTRIEKGGDPPRSGYTGTAVRFTQDGCRK
jgi:hypothetical protein